MRSTLTSSSGYLTDGDGVISSERSPITFGDEFEVNRGLKTLGQLTQVLHLGVT